MFILAAKNCEDGLRLNNSSELDCVQLAPSLPHNFNIDAYELLRNGTTGMMNAAANVTSQEDLDALRLTLSLFFAERAQKAIDKMWDEGTFDQKKLDELRGQHLRTPYK